VALRLDFKLSAMRTDLERLGAAIFGHDVGTMNLDAPLGEGLVSRNGTIRMT
jgi:hypothetical protein